jgi:hypothetical protein
LPTTHLIPAVFHERYQIVEWRNATGVLSTACPQEWSDIQSVLLGFRPTMANFEAPGGAITDMASALAASFRAIGWRNKEFITKISIDDRDVRIPTHDIDCVKGKVALEIQWSNKDPFFDRDLSNFRLLFDLQAIDVGVIITRSDELRDLYREAGKGYTSTSTWLSKLTPRVEAGVAGGCPILVFAIRPAVFAGRVPPLQPSP